MPTNDIRVLALFLFLCMSMAATSAESPAWNVAFYNIQSGKGEQPLPGRTAAFVENLNCTDATKPMNAWGMGLIQAELRARLAVDPRTIALGLGEAWLCGKPENVRQALGWAARTAERNGLALIARYGFSGPEAWLQLDTSLNDQPHDTRWVVRAPVCTDTSCSRSITVYATHWLGTGPSAGITSERQARATLGLMAQEGTSPHVLIGDLNVFEGTASVCDQPPNNAVLPLLRQANYLDVWREVHGEAEGFTGMLNRRRCGIPEGSPWKRIDYAWVRGYQASGMTRFGLGPPGDGAMSDHAGIIATISDTLPPRVDPREIVLRTSAAATAGSWRLEPDGTAAGGWRLRHPDTGAAKRSSALAAPHHYFEMTFEALPGIPYRVWMRARADGNYWGNDSVFVQFGDSVTISGTPVYRIGTTSATAMVLEEGVHAPMAGWGWQDNGYGYNVLGAEIFFASRGRHILRVQTREDGLAIDQLVLSALRFRTIAPGAPLDDTTVLPH